MADATTAPRGTGFARLSWVMLDWAASAFSTILITLVVAYVEKVVFPTGGWGLPAGVIWAWTLAAAMLIGALVAPWAAAWADRRHAHERAVLASIGLGVTGLITLAAMPPAVAWAVVGGVAIACVGFDLSQIFTGSLLSRIASGKDADRLSSWGFAAGYAGGAIALVGATVFVASHARFGLAVSDALRVAFFATAAWWAIFSLPAAVARFGDGTAAAHADSSVGELLAFTRQLLHPSAADGGRFGTLVIGGMLVLGAVQTAIAQFSSLALEEFDLDGEALVRLVLLVQVVALPGAIGIGWLSTRIGRPAALAVCTAGWSAVFVLAWFVQTPWQLAWLAVLLAIVLGGIQSVIRAAVAVGAPEGREGVTFGLMHVGSKLAGFVASLVFGAAQAVSGNPRVGLLTLLVQLLAGWWLLASRAKRPRD